MKKNGKRKKMGFSGLETSSWNAQKKKETEAHPRFGDEL